jgi:hypothetical protein
MLTPWAALAAIIALWAARPGVGRQALAAGAMSGRGVAGIIVDEHGDPVRDADLALVVNGANQPAAKARSQPSSWRTWSR